MAKCLKFYVVYSEYLKLTNCSNIILLVSAEMYHMIGPQPPNLAAATEKFTAAENPPKKFGRPQSGSKKIIRSRPDFFPAVAFYAVKFGTKVHVYRYSGDKMVSGRKKCKWNPFGFEMHFQFSVYAVFAWFLLYVLCDVEVNTDRRDQGSFPVGTPGNGVPKVILTVGTAFPGTQ